MSDQSNVNMDILKAWQDYLQNSLQDPKLSELMLSHYNKFQEFLRTANENSKNCTNADVGTANDVNVQHDDVTERLESLEARLSNLERLVASIDRKRNK
jgi:hypothetical protein